MSRRGQCRGSARRRASPAVALLPLVRFVGGGGTFTRSSEASYYTAAPNTTGSFLSWASSNVIREDKRDGVSGLYLFEPTKTNYCLWSEDFSNAAWSRVLTTITASTRVAPDGEADATELTFANGTAYQLQTILNAVLPASTFHVHSFWVRLVSGDTSGCAVFGTSRAGAATSTAFVPTSTWKRVEHVYDTGVGAGNYAVQIRCTGTGTVLEVWGAQCEPVAVSGYLYKLPTSYIRTTTVAVARSSDRLDFAAGLIPTALKSGKVRVHYAPLFASGAETNGLFAIYSNFAAYEGIQIVSPGSAPAARTTTGGAPTLAFTSKALTWARDTILYLTDDLASGVMSVSGAATGNGDGPFGVGPVVHPGGVTLQIGGSAANFQAMGRLGEPYVLPATTWTKLLDLRTVAGFTRSTEGSYYTGVPNTTGSFLAWAGVNGKREDKRDGLSDLWLYESSKTNLCLYSEAFDNASWTKTGGTTVGAGVTTAPDGEVDCKTLSFTAVNTDRIGSDVTGTADAKPYVTSVWVRRAAGAGNVRIQILDRAGATLTSGDIAVGATWTRVFYYAAWGTGAVTPNARLLNDAAGTAQDLEIWGFQVESAGQGASGGYGALQVPTSYIRTTNLHVTRGDDLHDITSCPSALYNDTVKYQVSPICGSTLTTQVVSMHFGFSGGGLGIFTSMEMRNGAVFNRERANVAQHTKTAPYATDQVLTIVHQPQEGYVTVNGATSGNGSGTAGTPVVATPTACAVGGGAVNYGTNYIANARIGDPYGLDPALPLAVGINGFATSSFYRSAANVLAANAAPFGGAVVFQLLAVPTAIEAIFGIDGVVTRGWRLDTNVAVLRFGVLNGVGTTIYAPTYTFTTADIGQTFCIAFTNDGTTLRMYRAGAEIGAGTAIVGYTAANNTDKTMIGIRSTSDIEPATDFRVLGATSFTGTPTAADVLAWYSATKAAKRVQLMGGTGVVVTDRWQAADNAGVAATWTDDVGGKVLTKTGSALVSVPYNPEFDV